MSQRSQRSERFQRLRTARRLCDFDSSVAAVRAVSRFLRGQDFPGLGVGPGSAHLADLLSHLPSAARRRAFVLGVQLEGAPVSRVRGFRSEDLAAWIAAQYGPGPYPAVFIGAGSGAAVHLAAALRAPVVPQTFLVPVRARLDPDQPRVARQAGLELGRQMVEANPARARRTRIRPLRRRLALGTSPRSTSPRPAGPHRPLQRNPGRRAGRR